MKFFSKGAIIEAGCMLVLLLIGAMGVLAAVNLIVVNSRFQQERREIEQRAE